MSEPTLTPSQALLVFGLLARHGECLQAELVPAVKKPDRDAVQKARLVTSFKVGRNIGLRLEDAGWAWAAGHLAVALPANQRALQDMLTRLGEHLAASGATLAEFIGPKPEAEAPPPKAKPKGKPAGARAKGRAGPGDTKSAIQRAFLEITGGRTGTDVRLAELRARLPDVDSKSFDAALSEMHLEAGKARLMRIEDGRAQTEADRSAAFHFKGDVFHSLWLDA